MRDARDVVNVQPYPTLRPASTSRTTTSLVRHASAASSESALDAAAWDSGDGQIP